MHKETYNINVACFCNKNFVNAIKELKPFLGFNIVSESLKPEDINENKFNAIMLDSESNNKTSFKNLKIPIIFIQRNDRSRKLSENLSLIIKLPLDITQFNQEIINVCKKYEFNKNSLIKIKDYILDKNERVLRKNRLSLKITEKEINFIEILFNFRKPLSRKYILKNIWNYSSDTDTHTVETHIYRLRQKIKKHFNDDSFIKNSKEGYSL